MPKKIDPEVRSRALRLLQTHGQEYPSLTAASAAIAKQVGVGVETVRRWAVQAEVDAGARPGTTSEESAEIRKLKAENRQLREDVAILKAATNFLRGGTRPPQPMIIGFIDTLRANGFAVESICRVLREQGVAIAARTYRAWRTRRPAVRTVSDAVVVDAVRDAVWRTADDGRRRMTPEGLYGRVKMRAHLDRTVLPGVSHGAVDRAMRTLRHNGVRRSKGIRTTIPAADGIRAGDLLNRQFRADEPNRVWVTDFTYVRSWAGWVCVVFIVDVFSRRIVAWHASTSKSVELVTVPLRMALRQRRREGYPVKAAELIHHSDAGSQYTSVTLTERLALEDIAASIGSVGDAYDNALIESANGLYKSECIRTTIFHSGPYRTASDVEFATAGWVDWYNNRRLHSSIGHVPPIEYETLHYAGLITEDQPRLETARNLG
ncbi:IS3 family transposase [Rhodococcoides corynebacterioides]|uniref:IS3 family transposase n=1 Tax=Rhodococcoides corynebacterioides TaxID=53972 RepID=A0ABS7P0D3_9NOCA|nr:IS3 family transposase [Rhodococcus corynebacterioides]MBY6365184.1 IS3 family transposase [Rhodococcus corynebacterioides]MBY6406596.1 IS3 family transposase [Rhodococcus corynebacterioides]